MMYPLIISFGESQSAPGIGSSLLGNRFFEVGGEADFAIGSPAFAEDAAASSTEALGRLELLDLPQMQTQWGFQAVFAPGWRVYQPAESVIIPPHTFPVIHRELRLGIEETETDGGNFRGTALRDPERIIRVRIQRPDADLLEELRLFGEALAATPTLRFTFTDVDRTVRKVALAADKLVIEPIAWEAGEPFDLLMREV